MVENNQIPKEATYYQILPFDENGEGPTLCSSKRPISLLNTIMKLLELIIVRRIIMSVEKKLATCQFAYRRQRSTERLLAELDGYVQDAPNAGQATYMVGLDMEGAFDHADIARLMEELKICVAQEI